MPRREPRHAPIFHAPTRASLPETIERLGAETFGGLVAAISHSLGASFVPGADEPDTPATPATPAAPDATAAPLAAPTPVPA